MNTNNNPFLEQLEECHCLQCFTNASIAGSEMERLSWIRFHIKWVSLFVLCAKLENPKSQLWVFSNDHKCLLEILDLLLYYGPTNDGALSPGTALRSCSMFHWTACAPELEADVLMGERTATAPLPLILVHQALEIISSCLVVASGSRP